MKDIKYTPSKNNNTVLDGLYSWSEYTYLKKIFGDKNEVTVSEYLQNQL